MRRTRLVTALALACALAARPLSAAPRSVILLSFDGTTPAQIADPELPTFARILREGVSAERLVSVFPSNTFPNHVTFVTGVAPDRHGIVNNVFLDPQRGRHSYANDPSWILVEPIWSWASRHGVVSASFHWVGSEGPWTSGRGPRHYVPFDGGTPESAKVARILEWLDLADPAERPRLVTAWFRGADGAGHRNGPDSPAARRTLRSQDAALGTLVAGLEARGLLADTALVLVSDHGMAKVERVLNLGAELRRAGVRAQVLGGGGVATLHAKTHEDAARAVALARELGLEAFLREEAPAAWRVSHVRFGDAVVLAPVGTALVQPGARGALQRLLAAVRLEMQGSHGHAPEAPEMGALFLAFGAGIEARRTGPVRAVDVAPSVLALLGLPIPEWVEGTPLLSAGSAVPSAATDQEKPER